MNILILGSGGREHAIALKISQSPKINKLYVMPGNPGTAQVAENVNIEISDFEELAKFAVQNKVEIIIPGPEQPLAEGIYDFFNNNESFKHIKVIGPSKKGAMLESSKDFAKEFMIKHNIPTARYKTFTKETLLEGKEFLNSLKSPYVLKADGLAAGKGVIIPEELDDAKSILDEMLNGKFGEASDKVVIEEFLKGIEVSVFVITDGENYKILPEAKDYKRIGEGDTGLNTGGMGAVSPVYFADKTFMQKVETRIIIPTIQGLISDKIDYKGFLFIGLMSVEGEPYVIEYNVRMGDPETEVVFPRIKSDVLELFTATANNKLNTITVEIEKKSAATIMLVSGGYPEAYEKGKEVFNIENVTDSIVFHAGTIVENKKILTAGGRVIAVTSFGDNIKEALNKSFLNADKITFDKKYYRKDIGFDLIKNNA